MNDFADIMAEKVFQLIMERQKELDAQFIEQVKESGADVSIGMQPYFGTEGNASDEEVLLACLLYTSPSPRDRQKSRMPSSA